MVQTEIRHIDAASPHLPGLPRVRNWIVETEKVVKRLHPTETKIRGDDRPNIFAAYQNRWKVCEKYRTEECSTIQTSRFANSLSHGKPMAIRQWNRQLNVLDRNHVVALRVNSRLSNLICGITRTSIQVRRSICHARFPVLCWNDRRL